MYLIAVFCRDYKFNPRIYYTTKWLFYIWIIPIILVIHYRGMKNISSSASITSSSSWFYVYFTIIYVNIILHVNRLQSVLASDFTIYAHNIFSILRLSRQALLLSDPALFPEFLFCSEQIVLMPSIILLLSLTTFEFISDMQHELLYRNSNVYAFTERL